MSLGRILKTGPALLMLLLVTMGLFTMHTLGHFHVPAAHIAGHILLTADHQRQAAQDPEGPGPPMGSMVMCVAILCALTVLAAAALLMRRLSAQSLPVQLSLHRVIYAVRGPPVVPIGLTLTNLSVLRT